MLVCDQLVLVPAFGRQCQAMLILVCWAMLILFLPGIVIRIKPQYLLDILKHFQFQSQKKINESNQISKHFSKYNLCSQSIILFILVMLNLVVSALSLLR